MTDPMYADQFRDVWLWQEWPRRRGKHDTHRLGGGRQAYGRQRRDPAPVLRVARDRGQGGHRLVPVCLGQGGLAERIIVSTKIRWDAHAEDAIQGCQQIPVRRIGMAELQASPADRSREVSDPRYIIDLLSRILTVSLETMKNVDAPPALDIRTEQRGEAQ